MSEPDGLSSQKKDYLIGILFFALIALFIYAMELRADLKKANQCLSQAKQSGYAVECDFEQ